MALKLSVPVLPNRLASRQDIVASQDTPATPVDPGHVAVYIGDTVPFYRSLEIVNGWRWLWNGLRDRNLLAATDGVTGPLYTASDIDQLNENTRRTSWFDNTPVTGDDIAIGVHNDVAQGIGAVTIIESAFELLRSAARDEYFKQA